MPTKTLQVVQVVIESEDETPSVGLRRRPAGPPRMRDEPDIDDVIRHVGKIALNLRERGGKYTDG